MGVILGRITGGDTVRHGRYRKSTERIEHDPIYIALFISDKVITAYGYEVIFPYFFFQIK